MFQNIGEMGGCLADRWVFVASGGPARGRKGYFERFSRSVKCQVIDGLYPLVFSYWRRYQPCIPGDESGSNGPRQRGLGGDWSVSHFSKELAPGDDVDTYRGRLVRRWPAEISGSMQVFN